MQLVCKDTETFQPCGSVKDSSFEKHLFLELSVCNKLDLNPAVLLREMRFMNRLVESCPVLYPVSQKLLLACELKELRLRALYYNVLGRLLTLHHE